MGFLKTNYFRIFIAVIVLAFILYFCRYLDVNDNFYNRMLKIRTAQNYSGIVIKKYIDSSQHNTPKLMLKDTLISLENIFWDKVSIGDSIVKIKGEQHITLYSEDREKEIFDYKEYFKNLSEANQK